MNAVADITTDTTPILFGKLRPWSSKNDNMDKGAICIFAPLSGGFPWGTPRSGSQFRTSQGSEMFTLRVERLLPEHVSPKRGRNGTSYWRVPTQLVVKVVKVETIIALVQP